MRTLTTSTIALVLLAATGCVSRGTYDEAVRSADDAHALLRREQATEARELAALQTKLDEQTALAQGLGDRLAQVDKSSDDLTAEKSALATALEQSRARLEEVRRAQANAEARARLFHDVALRLKEMVDSGDLSVVVRDGRMVLRMPNDVLFASGQIDVQPRGRRALRAIGAVLKTIPNRHFQIAGHTDDVPIDSDRFPSNWELSTARALEVTRLLIGEGVKPSALSAAGYADQDPIVANADERGRARNRRIEITLQPNIDELVSVPDLR